MRIHPVRCLRLFRDSRIWWCFEIPGQSNIYIFIFIPAMERKDEVPGLAQEYVRYLPAFNVCYAAKVDALRSRLSLLVR